MIGAGLLDEPRHDSVPVQLRDPKLELRLDDGHRRDGSMLAVVVDETLEVDVGDAVGVGDAHRFLLAEGRGRLP